ncbi:MAG: lysylphosphatidylglycerol synthase domain-containing protein, partial [Candidatus Poribacteria bacterium]
FFPIIALHTFWTNLLPMRAGDVSYIYLLKSREKVAGTKSVASLMVASVLDILLQLTLIVGIAWYFKPRLASKISYASFLLIPFIGILGLLSIVSISLALPKRCVIMTERIALTFQRLKTPVLLPPLNSAFRIPNSEFLFGGISWIADKLARVVRELTDISFNMKLFSISAYSVIILCMRFGMQCYLVKAMGFNLSILEILFALAFTAFCNMFPVQSVASIGTIELPWAWALISLGVSKDAAIASGLSLHIIIILYCVILGLYGAINRK